MLSAISIPLASGWRIWKDENDVYAGYGPSSNPSFKVKIFLGVVIILPVEESRLFEKQINIPLVVIEELNKHTCLFYREQQNAGI